MAEILDNVHTRLIYFDNFIFRSMILLLKYERVVIVADWTVMSFPKFPKKGSEVSTKEEGAKHSKINLGIRSPTVCYLMIVTINIKSH